MEEDNPLITRQPPAEPLLSTERATSVEVKENVLKLNAKVSGEIEITFAINSCCFVIAGIVTYIRPSARVLDICSSLDIIIIIIIIIRTRCTVLAAIVGVSLHLEKQ